MAFGKKNKSSAEEPQEQVEEREADFSSLDREESQLAAEETSSQSHEEIKEDAQAAIRKELAEMKDRYLRSLAEFENYKKHTLKERSDLLKYQGERIFTDLLEVVDNFELALQHSQADAEKLRLGVELIYKMLTDLLSKWEVRAESGVGQIFDPIRHNAISRAEVIDAAPGTIISELKKPYFYKDKLIRVGDVVVAVEPQKE